MKLFAIADLHLDSGGSKPMDVFGAQWSGHFEKIRQDWLNRVSGEDLVLIPGDISWAMKLEEALPDLMAIAGLPGMKVLTRGNHDYWWPGISRLRSVLPEGMYAVQNDAVRFGEVTVCGTRGWTLPGSQTAPEDQKIFDREVGRLRLSLDAADRLGGLKVAMLHYPPLPEDGTATPLSELLSGHGVAYTVYGHLHGAAGKNAFSGVKDGVRYCCVACDQIHFSLAEILDGAQIAPPVAVKP